MSLHYRYYLGIWLSISATSCLRVQFLRVGSGDGIKKEHQSGVSVPLGALFLVRIA